MQFLFVILMSVLVGASALPHLLQAPNRPSFSLRKSTSFSLVSLPKFFEKVSNLEKKLAELEESQKRKMKQLEEKNTSNSNDEDEENENEKSEADQLAELLKLEDQERAPASSYVGPKGKLMFESLALKACVCKSDGHMTCRLWINGYCSDMDEYVSIGAITDSGTEQKKNLRCKEHNNFSGFMIVKGKSSARVKAIYRDQIFEKNFSLINNCATFGRAISSEDE